MASGAEDVTCGGSLSGWLIGCLNAGLVTPLIVGEEWGGGDGESIG